MNVKTNQTILALCLLGTGVAFGQTSSTTSSTITTTTYSTDSSQAATSTGNRTTNTPSNSTYSTNSVTPINSTYSTSTTADRPATDGKRTDGKGGKFGVYAGVNFSQFVNEQKPAKSYRPGYQVGLYYRSPGTIFGQIGAEYRASSSNLVSTAQGSGTTPGTVQTELTRNIDQQFLAIPVYVGARIGGGLGFRIQAGAELAALVAVGQNDFKLGKDDLNRTILNGLVGAGINLGPLTLDAVYNHGFVQVFDKLSDTKRNILSLNVGFRF